MAEASQTTEETEPSPKTFDEKVAEEMEKAKDMKLGDLKLKLQAKGVLTSTFCEKSEFIRAYAEVVVKEAESGKGGDDAAGVAAGGDEVDDDDDSDADAMEEMPLHVKHRVEKLLELNTERENIMKDYLEERAKLEAKYNALMKPLYETRKDVVLGKLDEEIDKSHEDEKTEESNTDADKKAKGVPQFWVCALGRMEVIAELITEQDVDVLDLLEDVTCEDDENGEGFTLKFYFPPNDYFENTVLTKRYEVPNLLLADEPILKNVEGCEIKWKPGRSLTFKEVEKQQRGTGKNAGQVRIIKKLEKSESFFHFFTPPKMPKMEDMDEEQVERLESDFNDDYDIAQAFRSHVIPKAVLWFTGQAMEKDMEAAMKGMVWPDETNPSGDENPECKQS